MSIGMCSKALFLIGVLSFPQWSLAQSIYRCGNEYTNQPKNAKVKDCKPVDGGSVTVIHGSSSPQRSVGVSSSASGASAPRPAARSDSAEQRARDGDAKTILQAELEKATQRLNELKTQFQEGHPDRTALELRNPQGYIQRVEEMKASIARQESDIAGIQRELARLP